MTTIELLSKNLEEMQFTLREQALMLEALKGDKAVQDVSLCPAHCPYKKILQETLQETIKALEDSKKAFKSKQLEILRKRLVYILANNR